MIAMTMKSAPIKANHIADFIRSSMREIARIIKLHCLSMLVFVFKHLGYRKQQVLQNDGGRKYMELESVQNDARSSRLLAAGHLLKNREQIKSLWQKKVFEEISNTNGTIFPIMTNSLGTFLDELVEILRQTSPVPKKLSENAMSKIYGGEKALDERYSLSRLLQEFSIVRETISLELQDNHLLTQEVRAIIDKAIDIAMHLAATEFERVQHVALQLALSKAELSNRELEQFALIAAHDLNSPLATVTSLLSLLTDSIPSTSSNQVFEYIQFMEQTLTRMRTLVITLLEYARLGQLKTNFQKLSLNEVLSGALQNLTDLVQQNGAQVRSDSLPEVIGDVSLLSQVFQNLISNSIKYRGTQPPKIEISVTDKDPRSWLFSVKDNGVGFETTDAEEIFNLYKRLQNKINQPGAGIGLATCRRVIELHGGKIWAESHPMQGSTFFFTLPKI
jgi:signal transduction histidine kinase